MRIIDTRRVKMGAEEESPFIRTLAAIGLVAFSERPFKLKSGGESRLYANGRKDLTKNPLMLERVGGIINQTAWSIFNEYRGLSGSLRTPCLIGVPSAGSPLATAASLSGPKKIPALTMRERPKNYGNSSGWVDEAPLPDHLYITIDNVITDGESKFETIERLAADGFPAERIVHLVLVDRGQGGVERLRAAGHTVECVFRLEEIVRAFGELELWPPHEVEAALAELRVPLSAPA